MALAGGWKKYSFVVLHIIYVFNDLRVQVFFSDTSMGWMGGGMKEGGGSFEQFDVLYGVDN